MAMKKGIWDTNFESNHRSGICRVRRIGRKCDVSEQQN